MEYLLALQHLREMTSGVMDSFMLLLSQLGEPVVTFALLTWIYWCMDKHLGSVMIGSTSLACTYSQVCKSLFKVERPWLQDDRIQPVEAALPNASGYSFPSGHTTRGTVTWGTLVCQNRSRIFGIIGIVISALVAFSRNYLGVHTLKDILGGFALAAAGIIISNVALKWCDKRSDRDYLIALIGCILLFLPMLRVGCMSNAGTGMGLLIGWCIERHFIQFEIEEATSSKLVRFILGLLGLLLIMKLMPTTLGLFIQAKYAGFFANFLLGIYITVIYPFIFSKAKGYTWGITAAALILVVSMLGGYAVFSHAEEVKEPDLHTVEQNASGDITPIYAEGDTVQVIGHRGYSAEYPENTLSSFKGAIEMGADYVELDVQLTKDGEVVVFHDNDLSRIVGCEGTIADYTLEELKAMDFGAYFSPSYAGEQIPTLAEVMELVKPSECGIYLELKNIGDVEGFADKVVAIATEYEMHTDAFLPPSIIHIWSNART